jgi:predicted RNA methylase
MKFINTKISKKQAEFILHNHSNIFSYPIYHLDLINPKNKLKRFWKRKYNDTYVFIKRIFDIINIEDKTIYDFGCNIGTLSFLALEYNPKVVYGIDIDENILSLANYIKNINYAKKPIYFIKGDITSEKIVFKDNNLGLLVNLPFGPIETMVEDVTKFLSINATEILITDELYDDKLEHIFNKFYNIKKKFGYYNVYRHE